MISKEKIKLYLSNVLFKDVLEKIENDNLRNYFLKFFLYKTILFKFLALLAISFISFLLFFVLRDWSLTSEINNVVFNKGSGYGMGSTWPQWVVYLIKAIPTLIFFLIFLFLNDWKIFVPSLVISINALCNIIDKAIPDWNSLENIWVYDAVVDYLHFDVFHFTCNIADILLVTSFVLLALGLIWNFIVIIKKNNDQDKNDEQEKNDINGGFINED